jgi:hypothetical protein
LKKSLILLALMLFAGTAAIHAQKAKPRKGQVCGDPTAACKLKDNFQPHDLPFDTGKNFVIYESEFFYGIILKSVKLKDFGDCATPSFTEQERLDIQALFEHNKVFAQNCVESGTSYYTNVAEQTALIGVYAGHTLAEANTFLKEVQATGKFPDVKVRKMRAAINGT